MEGYISRSDLTGEFPFTIFRYTVHGLDDSIHWHRYMQIGLCLNGKGKFFFSDKVYEAEKDDIFISNNFESHVAVTDPNKAMDYLFVVFLPEVIAYPGCRQFDFQYLYPYWYNPKTFDNKISRDSELAERLKETMLVMEKIFIEKETDYQHELDACLRLLLTMLIKHYKKEYNDYFSFDSNKHNKLQEAMNYINAHYLEKISLEDIAAKFYMSTSRFRHLFKETLNMGFKEYVTYLRLSEAKRLLIYSDTSIKEIAALCGFSNLNQFYKVFNKYVYMMPAEYRKNQKVNIDQDYEPK